MKEIHKIMMADIELNLSISTRLKVTAEQRKIING